MMKKIKEKIVSIYNKIQNRWQLREMDDIWNLYGGGCFGLHQPSFYHKHSEEEVERIQKQEISKLQDILNDYQMRHNSMSGQR